MHNPREEDPSSPGRGAPCARIRRWNLGKDAFFSESRDLLSRREAWVEAASWTAEERKAGFRGDPTEEVFASLAFGLCVQRTQDLEPR